MRKKEDLRHDDLIRLLNYDEHSGDFTWAQTRFRVPAGTKSGNETTKGYWTVFVSGRNYLAHRLAWFYAHKTWPVGQIDHINRNKLDNRLVNLRQATNQENHHNKPIQSNNKSGRRGVCWHKGGKKWVAQAKINGVRVYLGLHDTIELASSAFEAFAKNNYTNFYSSSFCKVEDLDVRTG